MKVDKVIMSCDDKRYYLDFWPLVSKVWKRKFNIHPVLLLFGNKKELNVSEEFGSVIEFKTDPNIASHIQALWARYWYPITEPDTTWMISDIDMFPMSRHYFIDILKDIPDNMFVNTNANKTFFPSCYNIAKGKTFAEVLKLPDTWEESIDIINNVKNEKDMSYTHTPESIHIYETSTNDQPLLNWGIDEAYACRQIANFSDQSRIKRVERPGGFCHRRLDRTSWHPEDDKIINEWYNDCHSIRPYNSGHKQEIDRVVELILRGF